MKLLTTKRPAPSWRVVLDYVKAGSLVIGIDEVGRGAWAGPVTAAAVILPPRLRIQGLADSKLLSPTARERLDREIKRHALGIGIGWVSGSDIDRLGLTQAVRKSALQALDGLSESSNTIIVLDGKHNYLSGTHNSVTFVGADARITPVAAASVVAKVARDRYMAHLAKHLPGYGFEVHKGYGTAAHKDALKSLGPSDAHRLSWSPFAGPAV